jgi:hypothetical protein
VAHRARPRFGHSTLTHLGLVQRSRFKAFQGCALGYDYEIYAVQCPRRRRFAKCLTAGSS